MSKIEPLNTPRKQCLHQLFEAQVERRPDTVAVTLPAMHQFKNTKAPRQLTYQTLNQQANQLAHHLQKLGVGPEVLVGVYLDRSLEMIVAILGILKAGGAYLPLDLVYPKERLTFMLEDAQTSVLITESSLLEKLPNHQAKVVCLDTDWNKISQESAENVTGGVQANNLAYVIYTSGSTGKPKGVLVSHYNVVRLFKATQTWFNFDNQDVWTLFHSYAFDFSVWEIWGALLYGGHLVVVPFWVSRSPEAFYSLVCTEQVTILNQTPSAFRQFIRAEEALGVAKKLSLRLVIFGGEALHFHHLKPWFECHGDQHPQLVNMYGITETTVHVTYRPLTISDLDSAEGSLIGQPIPDLHLYLLDEQLQPVPDGETGELHVGGIGVARGYLKRPRLTAERFIPDPFSNTPETRMYKSGDLARRLPNGDIEYLGRSDQQVKMRGFRIELGEIEAALIQHPAISEAVVVAKENTSDKKQLVAYLISSQNQSPTVSELHRFLKQKLPEYMVPSAFVLLDTLPLTPNGKLDRNALPVPDLHRPDLETSFVPSRSKLEQELSNLWEQVLGIEQIGIYDNFFELGGDSLKAAILANKIQKIVGEYLYFVAIFEAPTIAELAAYLNKHYPNLSADLKPTRPQLKSGKLSSQIEKINNQKIAQLRQFIRPLLYSDKPTTSKNPPAIFILTPPRSGSTLLRVMLAGHPDLFAPPELDLLSFNTLKERKTTLSGENSFRLTGTIRAIMQIKGCDAEQAESIMEDYIIQGLTVKQFYKLIQEWVNPATVVDKSTFYALDLETLRRLEADFDNALYIHLLRHPYGMIRSFEQVRADRLYFKKQQLFSKREVAELTWLIGHQNIEEFLNGVPASRQYQVKFEDLVKQPEATVEKICQFLNLKLHLNMLQPYQDKAQKMTDGVYANPASRMAGDVRFHEHKDIDPKVADDWKMHYTDDFLGNITWQMAESLGYVRDSKLNEREYDNYTALAVKELKPIRPITRRRNHPKKTRALLAKLDQLSDEEVETLLASELQSERDLSNE